MKMFGYTGINDFTIALFKSVDSLWLYKYVLPFILIINGFFEWVFVSTGGIYFLMVVYVLDFFSGVSKAVYNSMRIRKLKKVDGFIPPKLEAGKLQSKKFPRFLLTMGTAIVMLVLMKVGAMYTIVFIPLYGIFYAVFLTQQMISMAENLTEMGLLDAGVLKKIKTKLSDVDFSITPFKKNK